MKIINMSIDELKPYAHNPKTHPEAQIDKIARSIKEFGFLVPILDRWANYTKEDPIREDGMMWSELKESQQL